MIGGTKIIHNFSEKFGVDIGYNLNTFSNSTLEDLAISAGFQFNHLNYGYLDFNLKLIPSVKIPLSGASIPKPPVFPTLSVVLDFI